MKCQRVYRQVKEGLRCHANSFTCKVQPHIFPPVFESWHSQIKAAAVHLSTYERFGTHVTIDIMILNILILKSGWLSSHDSAGHTQLLL